MPRRISPPASALRTLCLVASLGLTACADDAVSPTAPVSLDRRAAAEQDGAMPQLPAGAASATSSAQAAKLAAAGQAPPAAGARIPGQFIVVFKDDVADAPGLARRLSAAHGAAPRFTYDGAIKGFSFKLPAAAAERVAAALARNPQVAYVEQDAEARGGATQYFNYANSYGHAWGLDRIDQRGNALSGSYSYGYTGAGVHAYIIDSGIQPDHPEFGGRARIARNYVNDGWYGRDCHGHGTHVAGTVGSRTYGVAKGVQIRSLKVLGCDNRGSGDAIIAAVNWVYLYRVSPAVANISIGMGQRVQAVNDAVTRLANSGVFVAVAAGNDNKNACYESPASAPGAFTVAASTWSDTRAVFSVGASNWGGCVDAYAPGDQITSTWPGSRVHTMPGTSMASPHVAGVAALYKQAYGNAASATIVNWLVYYSTKNAIRNDYTGTPNRLLWKGTF